MSVNAASTPVTVSDGSGAGGGIERSAAQPTPICRCGSSPDSQDTTIAASPGSALRSTSAIRAVLASREDVPPTSAEAVATSWINTVAAWHEGPTRQQLV